MKPTLFFHLPEGGFEQKAESDQCRGTDIPIKMLLFSLLKDFWLS
jgi:hypothetical protein